MRNAIWIICLCFLLTGCHRNLSESISLEVKSDLTTIEKQIDDIRYKLPNECLNIIENDLNGLSDKIKQTQTKVDNLNKVCKMEKDEIRQKLRSRTFALFFLLFLQIAMIVYWLKSK